MNIPNKVIVETISPSSKNSPAAIMSIIHHMRKEDAKNAKFLAGRK
jgi:hypothetical protein